MRSCTIITPLEQTSDLAEDGALTYWKQILPQTTIYYKGRQINFDQTYLNDCIDSFRGGAVQQTMFQLANPLNSHGRDFDPERQRGEVIDMALADGLPDSVKEHMGNVKPGLYAKIKFFNAEAARAVQENPGLGVSARVRENFPKADGSFIKRAIIHVLGTIDPRVTGMSSWLAADLAYDDDDEVLDLSGETDERSTKMNTDELTDADIAELSDEELADLLESLEDTGPDGDEDDDTDADDTDADEDVHERELVGSGASLSNDMRRSIDLANSQAEVANAKATEALTRMAQAEWLEYRGGMVREGVPPYELDLAEAILNRPDALVIDLSASGEDDINVAAIVRELLEAHKGTVDMSYEQGHGGGQSGSDADNDAPVLAAWSAEFGN